MDLIDRLLEALVDGKEHSFYELDTGCLSRVRTTKIIVLVEFLSEFGFVEVKRDELNFILTVKAVPRVVEFLKKMRGDRW